MVNVMIPVCTIGYEGTDIDRFVATLKNVGIDTLVDVRAVPISRKKGFSKKALSERLYSANIEYIHLKHLGDPKTGRDAARDGRFTEFRNIYRNHLLTDEAQSHLEELRHIVENAKSCLMCFERDYQNCHRLMVVQSLEIRDKQVFHLYGDLPRRYDNFFLQSNNSSEGLAAAE